MVLYNDVTTSRSAQRIPYKDQDWISARLKKGLKNNIPEKAFTIQNNEVAHFNIEMNGYELNTACAVTMNGQSYIFQAAKQSDLYGKQYVLLLGGVRLWYFLNDRIKPWWH